MKEIFFFDVILEIIFALQFKKPGLKSCQKNFLFWRTKAGFGSSIKRSMTLPSPL
jgi:hypothetical protein